MSNVAGTEGNADEVLASGWQRHQAGDLAGAEQLYRQVLAAQPTHSQALHFLGCLALQVGQIDQAIAILSQAVASHPAASRSARQPRSGLSNCRPPGGRPRELPPRFATRSATDRRLLQLGQHGRTHGTA